MFNPSPHLRSLSIFVFFYQQRSFLPSFISPYPFPLRRKIVLEKPWWIRKIYTYIIKLFYFNFNFLFLIFSTSWPTLVFHLSIFFFSWLYIRIQEGYKSPVHLLLLGRFLCLVDLGILLLVFSYHRTSGFISFIKFFLSY